METDTSKTCNNDEGKEVLHFHPSVSHLTGLQFPVQEFRESLPAMVARLQTEHDLIICNSLEPPSNQRIGHKIQGINVLTPDLLAVIFSKLGGFPGLDHFRVMTACKQWRTVAVTEPKLWTRLDFSSFSGVQDDDVVRAIQRSDRRGTFFSIQNCHQVSEFVLDALHNCLKLEEVHIGSSKITGPGVISFLTALKLAKDSHPRIEHLLEGVDNDSVFSPALSSNKVSDQQLGQTTCLPQPTSFPHQVDSIVSRDSSGRQSVSSSRLQGFSGLYSESGGRSGLSGALVGIWESGVSSRRSDRGSIVLSEVDESDVYAAKEEDNETGGSIERSEDNGGIESQSGIMLALVNRRKVIRDRRSKMNRKLNTNSKTEELHHLQLELLQLTMEMGDYNDDEEDSVPPCDEDDDELYDDLQEGDCGQEEEQFRGKKMNSLVDPVPTSEDSSINNQGSVKSLSGRAMEGSVFEEGESSKWSTGGDGCDLPQSYYSEHVIAEENRLSLLQARVPENRLALRKLWMDGVRYITSQQYDVIKNLVGWMDGAICKQCREVHVLQQCMHCDNNFCNDCRDSDQCAACGTSSCRQAPCPQIITCQACDESFCRSCRTIWECDSCCRAYCDSHLSFTQFCGIGLQYCEACVARNKLKRPFWTCIGCMG